MSEWIAVKDRLPEPGVMVWVWGTAGTPFDWFVGGKGYQASNVYTRIGAREWVDYRCDLVRGKVTHWMSLPEPPK